MSWNSCVYILSMAYVTPIRVQVTIARVYNWDVHQRRSRPSVKET